jgi:hypothetical protein
MFRPNWPSSGVQVVVMKGSAAHCDVLPFLYSCNGLIVRYVDYPAVTMHMFGLWFNWFIDFPLVQYLAVLNVFVGAEQQSSRSLHHNNLYT